MMLFYDNTNIYIEPNTTGPRDPRCPYCGRPVLEEGIVGVEGRYHLECARPPRPPVPADWPGFPPATSLPSVPWPGPYCAS